MGVISPVASCSVQCSIFCACSLINSDVSFLAELISSFNSSLANVPALSAKLSMYSVNLLIQAPAIYPCSSGFQSLWQYRRLARELPQLRGNILDQESRSRFPGNPLYL